MQPSEIARRAGERLDYQSRQKYSESSEALRLQEAVLALNSRATSLLNDTERLYYLRRNRPELDVKFSHHDELTNIWPPIIELSYVTDAPELISLDVPSGYKPIKTISLAYGNPRGRERPRNSKIPLDFAVLTQINMEPIEGQLYPRPKWPIEGMQFLERVRPDLTFFDRMQVGHRAAVQPDAIAATQERELHTPPEAIISGMHVALDGLEERIAAAQQSRAS